MGHVHRSIYRASGGRVLGSVRGIPVVLLTTTGRRSGKQRTAPLLAFHDGANLVVIASNGGEDRAPAWWLNLQHQPQAVATIDGSTARVVAVPISEEERARLWAAITARFPQYNVYQRRTARPIPVVVLRPVAAAAA